MTRMNIYVCVNIYTYVYTYIHTCVRVCMYTHTYVFILFLPEFSYYFLILQPLRCKEESRAIETQLLGS